MKRIITLIVSAALLLSLTACGSGSSNSGEAMTDYNYIKTSAKAIVGIPNNEELKGFNAEFAKFIFNKIGSDAGVNIEIVTKEIDASDVQSALEKKQVDCVFSVAVNDETENILDFSNPYLSGNYAALMRNESDLTAKINQAIYELRTDGTLSTLAEKYSLTVYAAGN